MSAPRTSARSGHARGWDLDVRSGGVVVARHTPSGARMAASFVLRAGKDGAKFRVVRFDYTVPDGVVTDGPAAPIERLEEAVNEPGMMQVVLDSLLQAPVDGRRHSADATARRRCSKTGSDPTRSTPMSRPWCASASRTGSPTDRVSLPTTTSPKGPFAAGCTRPDDAASSISRDTADRVVQKSRFSRILAALPLRSRR